MRIQIHWVVKGLSNSHRGQIHLVQHQMKVFELRTTDDYTTGLQLPIILVIYLSIIINEK